MGELYRVRASDPAELQEIDFTHDAYFDPDDIRFDSALDQLVVPYAQEPYPEIDGGPVVELVSCRRRTRAEKVPFLRHELHIGEVEKWGLARDGRDQPGMLLGLRWRSSAREIRFQTGTGPEVSVVVRHLDATLVVTDEVVHWVRRKHGRFGGVLDTLPEA